jgi:hypothetical protein
MTAIVQAIPVGARLFDTIGALTVATLRAMKDAGGDGVIAYLRGNLVADAIENAFGLGMGIVPVNFSHAPGWVPSADLGTKDGELSVEALVALQIPMVGLSDWCDVEGCGVDPTAYARAWCAQVGGDGAGRVASSYEGAGALLTGVQWYELPFRGYWRSGSRAIPEPTCGFQLDQVYPLDQPLPGAPILVDYDFARRDFFGRAPTWLRAKP